MIQTFEEVEAYLAQLTIKPTSPAKRLAFVKEVLRMLGSPQNIVPAIHIAGTSGKGSTAYYADSLLRQSGYRVGLAVSPHINSVAERSQINGAPLPEEVYCRYFNEFTSITERLTVSLSYIEFLTIFTYWLFAQEKLDYMVIEVGLGGRLDPTNTITSSPTVRVITDIGLDHTEILGETLPLIAKEKAGIIHKADSVIVHEQSKEVMDVFKDVATQIGTTLASIEDEAVAGSDAPRFQQRNATLALAAASELLKQTDKPSIPAGALLRALQIQIPGRFEILHYEGVKIVLDVAHNRQKIAALIAAIGERFPAQRVECLVALGNNKASSAKDVLALLRPIANSLVLTQFTSQTDVSRSALSLEKMCSYANEALYDLTAVAAIDNPYVAFEQVVQSARRQGTIVVVTGSFYLIDGIRKVILNGLR